MLIAILLFQGIATGALTSSFGITAYAQKESEFLLYDSTEFGISMKYPNNWQMMENPDEFTLVLFMSPLDSTSDAFQENVLITLEGVSETITLDDLTDTAIQSIVNEFTLQGFAVNVLDSESITISKNNAHMATYTVRNEDVSFKQAMFTTIKGNIAYMVTFTAEENEFSDYIQTVQTMVDSIEIRSLPPLLPYENLAHGIKMEYPSSWMKSELDEPATTIVFTAPMDNLQDAYQETFAILITDGGPAQTDPSQYAENMMNTYSQQLSNFNLVESSETSLSGNSAVKKIYTATNAGFDLKGVNIFLAIDTKNFMIQFTSDSEKRFSEYLPVVQEMINSIVIDGETIATKFNGKYTNEKSGLEIQFPQGWTGIKLKQDGMHVASAMSDVPTNPLSSEINPNFAMMTLVVGDLGKLLEVPEPQCDIPYMPAKILELNGMKALEFTGNCLEPTMNVKLKMTGYLIATNNDFINIGYSSGSDETYEKEISKFRESLGTLRISNTIDISESSNYAKIFGLALDKKSIKFDDQTIEIDIATNSTITDFSFDAQNEKISFGVEQSGKGITEIFIGKVLEPPYTVTIDGKSIADFTITNDETTGEIIVSFDYEHPVKQVVIEGKIISDNLSLIQEKDNMQSQIPDWIRNNASWWVEGNIDDSAFVGGIQFLIKEGIIQIPETTKSTPSDSQEIPTWIKNNADWWSQGLISDNDFLKGITFLVENGIITV